MKILITAFIVMFCLSQTAVGGGVTLSGNIHVSRMKSDGSIWEEYDAPFRVSLSGSKWRMSVEGNEDHREVSAFDETNLYSFVILSDRSIARFNRLGITNPLAPAYISSSSYPFFGSSPAVQVLWFALLSESYLLIHTNDLPSPWAKFGNMDLHGHLTKLSKLHFNTGSPRWPLEAQFVYSSEALLSRSNIAFVSSSITPDDIEKAASDLKDSKLDNRPVAQYRVLSTTNFADQTFPSEFEFDVVGEKGPPPLQSWVIESFVGTVINISGDVPEEIVPKPPAGLSVSDFRFSGRSRRIDDLRYSITDGAWLAKEDPKLMAMFGQLQASTPVYRYARPWRFRLMFLVIILLAALPLVFALRNARSKKTRTTQSEHITERTDYENDRGY